MSSVYNVNIRSRCVPFSNMPCRVLKNHFTCNIFIRVVILKEVEQEQLWATWEAGELNRQPAEVNFTEAFLFSTFFTLPFLLQLFLSLREIWNHQLKYQYQRLSINISINSFWKKRRWCLKMFWLYFQNADVDSQCATGPMSGDAHQRSGPTICMAGGQGGVENA